MLPIPPAPADSTIDVEWAQIDTSYHATRAGFDTLQARFGHFIIRKGVAYAGDTTDISSRFFDLRFDSIVDIDSATKQMLAIPMLVTGSVYYENRAGGMSIVTKFPSGQTGFSIYPNPASSTIHIAGDGLVLKNHVEIFLINGQRLKEDFVSESHPLISTTSLPSALYVLKVNGVVAGLFLVVH